MPASLSYKQLHLLLSYVSPIILDSILIDIKEESENKWIFFFKKNDHVQKLLISIKKPFLRFVITKTEKKLYTTPFTKNIFSYFKDAKLFDCQLLNNDRILSLSFSSGYQIIVEFFQKFPNFYIVDKNKKITLAKVPIQEDFYSLPKPYTSYNETDSFAVPIDQLDQYYEKLEKEFFFFKKKHELEKKIQKRIKNSEKHLKNTIKDAQNVNPEKIYHEASLLQIHYSKLKKGLHSIDVEDFQTKNNLTIQLNPTLPPQEQLFQFFKKAKKEKRKASHAKENIQRAKNIVEKNEKLLEKIKTLNNEKEILLFEKKVAPSQPTTIVHKKKPVIKGIRQFLTNYGSKIFVGKTDKDNEFLSFSLANGSDYWFHVSGMPGSHVVLKTTNPKEEEIFDAAQIALYYSKAKEQQEAEIVVTQCKYLKRIKGALGKVQLSKHKHLFIRLDKKRLERLKQNFEKKKLL